MVICHSSRRKLIHIGKQENASHRFYKDEENSPRDLGTRSPRKQQLLTQLTRVPVCAGRRTAGQGLGLSAAQPCSKASRQGCRQTALWGQRRTALRLTSPHSKMSRGRGQRWGHARWKEPCEQRPACQNMCRALGKDRCRKWGRARGAGEEMRPHPGRGVAEGQGLGGEGARNTSRGAVHGSSRGFRGLTLRCPGCSR